VRVGPHEVDVRYRHIGGYDGVDQRRFHVERVEVGDGSGGAAWGVVQMYGYRSGIYALASPDNVVLCPRLEYSVLREKEKELLRRRERKRKAQEMRSSLPTVLAPRLRCDLC